MTKKHARKVATNIITGFLGTGKTSTIMHLMAEKKDNERWAILVNEFGEIGVDGSIFWGNYKEQNGVFIKEVPGGCMCCASGFPMQIALSQLLSKAKPDRLLIEPTGLGHPFEVLALLSGDHYRDILTIEKVITLVDARKVRDSRYTEHAIFNQQIAIADIIIGNKQDLYSGEDRERLQSYVKDINPLEPSIVFTERGAIDRSLLAGKTRAVTHQHTHGNRDLTDKGYEEPALPPEGYLKAENTGEGFMSIGWRFSAEKVFDRSKLFGFLSGLVVERMKGVFITEDGIFAYNLTRDALTEQALDDCTDSRIEIIADSLNDSWESGIFACLREKITN